MNRKILCVDDEEAILRALRLHIRKKFDMHTANNGAEGLEIFEKEGPFAVVTADMRMPGMDGATMLAKIKELNPHVSTVLLTGHADFEFGGAAALQTGKLLSILTKPCPPERFKKTLEEGVREYNRKSGQDQEDDPGD